MTAAYAARIWVRRVMATGEVEPFPDRARWHANQWRCHDTRIAAIALVDSAARGALIRSTACGASAPEAMSIERTLERAMHDAQSGRLDAAMASVRTVLRLQPGNSDALQLLGLFLTQSGQQEQAVVQLERAVAIAPRVAGYRNNLGNALVGAGRHRDAVDQYRAAIEIDPSYVRAYLGLALALVSLRESDAAVEACHAGLRLRPDWPEMAMCAAAAYEAGDRMDEAVTFLEQAVARMPSHAALRSRYLFSLNYVSWDVDLTPLLSPQFMQ